MPIPTEVEDRRHWQVPEGKSFQLVSGQELKSLDDLSEAINLIDPETFMHHVNAEKNDFASWVQHVFDEQLLSEYLRRYPTPLRMMVHIEKFLRNNLAPLEDSNANAEQAA
ncbi:MAG TPA: hypothetical protein VLA04_04825 [Verrucomicrobiae bacterium]|nr:hypothetical protein [Verrucomicrobiae bacterium]